MAYNDSPQRPLIDRVRNRWDDEKTVYDPEMHSINLEDEGSCAGNAAASRRSRRLMLFVLVVLVSAFCIWSWYLRPRFQEEWEYEEGFLMSGNGTLGIAKGGDFDGVRLQDLDSSFIPGGESDPEGKRRLVFVGDIHGCAHELKKLLKRVNFDERTDHLVAVGDLVSKGPENAEVLDELIRLKASSVRGNHEDRLLAMAPSILDNPDLSDSVEPSGSNKDAALLRQLSPHHLEFLLTLPLMLRIPALPLAAKPSRKSSSPIAEEMLVVHAGLVPALPLDKQDPFFVMNMRSMYTKTHLPLVEAKGKKGRSRPWHDIWGWYNDRLSRKKSLKDFRIWGDLEEDDSTSDSWFGELGLKSKKKWPKPQVVVYGHHAKAGLQISRWSKGLDTGCVRGGKLTAMVVCVEGRQEIVSVKCKDYR